MQLVETLVVYKKINNQLIKIMLSRRKKEIMNWNDNDLIHDIEVIKMILTLSHLILFHMHDETLSGFRNWFIAYQE